MLQRCVEAGLLTQSAADSLDAWAGELAAEFTAGRITAAEAQARIMERLRADIIRRGQA